MRKFIGLTKRNLLVFLKDKESIIYSLLTSIIILVLYLLFLKGTFVETIESVLEDTEELKNLVLKADIEAYANLILLVGILGSAMITVPFNCLTTVVYDREKKIDYDISATPIRRWQIILSYFTSAAISSILLNGIILTVGLIILKNMGGLYMTYADVAAAYGVVALGSLSATSLFMIVVLFFHSASACGAFVGMIAAAAGFVTGAYIPISQFSKSIQTLCNAFPASQITILLRNVLLNSTLDRIDTSIGGVDGGMFVKSMKHIFSFKAYFFGHELGICEMLLYVVAGIVVSIVLMVVVYKKTYKRK